MTHAGREHAKAGDPFAGGLTRKRALRWGRVSLAVARAVTLWSIVGIASAWAMGALWYFSPWPIWVRIPAVLFWVALVTGSIARLPAKRARWTIAAGVLVVWIAWTFRTPSDRRDWTADQKRMPTATFEGNSMTIENFRLATYRDEEDYDVRWQTQRFDLDTLESVDFVIEPFASWRGPAHTFLTFGFDDGRHVAISIEIRKERGEVFSPWAAMFRQYEMMYVVGDERDLIGLRVNVRKNPVYLFPIKADRSRIRTLFVSMLQRANRLDQQPEFYNIATNTCTTNIVSHLEEVAGREVPWDLRVLLPGYADELAFELDLVDFDGTVTEARTRFLISDPVATDMGGRGWSLQIRQPKRVAELPDPEVSVAEQRG